MKRVLLIALLMSSGYFVSGCFQAHSDDDLRSVPVTNNPNLIPKTAHTAQAPGFGN